MWKRLNFCGSGSTLKKEAGSGSKLGSIRLFEEPEAEAIFHKTWDRNVEAVKFLWKRKHFKERSCKRKQTRKRLTLYGAGSGSKKIFYCFNIPASNIQTSDFYHRALAL